MVFHGSGDGFLDVMQMPEHSLERSRITAARIPRLFVLEDRAQQIAGLFHWIGLTCEFRVH